VKNWAMLFQERFNMRYIYENLIADGAYRFFLMGLGFTLYIVAVGLIIGTFCGIILCAMSLSRFKILQLISRGYTLFMSGTPVILILMLFFYVILAPFGIDAVLTAICAFGLRSGALIGEIMKSALAGVEQGQINAARTLGFSRWGAFFNVTLPQAIRIGKPLYKHNAVTLIQDTSVVGYITVNDLTRVVNSMGSRTGNPLMSLMVGIAIYLLLSGIVSTIFNITDGRLLKRKS
jgi:polar amino acid transport system permease protein/polar amino acid transport system substrate-binding protein